MTYPYIMAKVRIQARSPAVDADDETGPILPHTRPPPPTRATQTGAIGLLIRVLKTEGFVGWYQVRNKRAFLDVLLISVAPPTRACQHRSSRRCCLKRCCSSPRSNLSGGRWR